MRMNAELSGVTLAARVGWAQSKVSRLENGRQLPARADLAAWVHACGVGPDEVETLVALLAEAESDYQDWRRRQRHGQAAVQRGYFEMLQAVTTIRYFETAFIPGLLQTRAYARHVMGLLVEEAEPADLDAAVAERTRAQQLLYDTGKAFEFLVAEPVLHWWPCPPDVMRAQLDRLQTAVDLPNVRFGVVPMRRQLHTLPVHGFSIIGDAVLVETFTGEITHTGADADRYGTAMGRLWNDAITGEAVRQRIIDAMPVEPDA
jgi:transcriptional regulator with XRE-family HTH domain